MLPQALDIIDPMRPLPYRVVETREEIPGCHTLRVKPADNTQTSFSPGQFYMLYAFGHGEVPVSVSGDPSRKNELIFTIMNVGSVTAAICALESGAMLGLRGPFGSTWPLESAKGRDIIIMSGGLGLAPLRPVIYRILSNRRNYGKVSVLYGARRPEIILFREEMDEWCAKGITVEVTVDSAGRDWPGHVGVVTNLVKEMSITPAQTTAMICGPEVMMRFCARTLMDAGISSQDIHVSMERNMKCAVARCGRCQYGPYFICKDGPVFPFAQVERLFAVREV